MIFDSSLKGTFILRTIFALTLLCTAPAASAQVMEIEVDTLSGEITMSNPTMSSFEFDVYSIQSPLGSLLEGNGNWNSFSDRGIGSWVEAGSSSQFLLAELSPSGSSTFDAGDSISLGNAYNVSTNSRDLEFTYLLVGESSGTLGTVRYVTVPEPSTLLLVTMAGMGFVFRKRQ